MTNHSQKFRIRRDPVRRRNETVDESCRPEKSLARGRRKLRIGLAAVLLASVPACDLVPVEPGDDGIEDIDPNPQPDPDPGPQPDPDPEPDPDPNPDPGPDPEPDPEPDPGANEVLVIEPRGSALQGDGAADADDPAIWIHPDDPARSLLFLSDKARGIYVFDLQGNQLQHVDFGTRLNNIDVRSGFAWQGSTIDVVAGNLRNAGKLALLRIHRDWQAGQVVSVLADAASSGNSISPDSYGLALYRRPDDGALFVIDKSDGSPDARQWRISETGGAIVTTQVRVFNDIAMGRAEGFVVDDQHGYLYMAEERGGIHQYHADPKHPVQTRLEFFAEGDGIEGDREGLALYGCPDSGGYLVLSSQGNSTFKVYERDSHRLVRTFRASGARGTDGLDVTARAVPGFPQGFLVIHDERGARYLVYDWSDVAASALQSCGH